ATCDQLVAASEVASTAANTGPFFPRPQIRQALEMLRRRKIPNGIVSNGRVDFQLQKITDAGLLPYFDDHLIVIRPDRDPGAKPSPGGLLACAGQAGEHPGNMAYIGNRKADIVAANLAGYQSIMLPSGSFDFKEPQDCTLGLEQPDFSAASVTEL